MKIKKCTPESSIDELKSYLDQFCNLDKEIKKAQRLIIKTLRKKKKILICGNGGSAAQAQHLAAEFLIRLNSNINRAPWPVLSLATDTSTITACTNDYKSEILYSRVLKAIGNKNDLLIAISTSGNSKNIINALIEAKKKINTLSFIGNNGGMQKKFSNLNIILKGKKTSRIQEAQLFIGHYIFDLVEKKLLYKKNIKNLKFYN